MEIFWYSNTDSDSVSDAESHDIKILTRFPGNLILEIFIENLNCVGCTNMRGCFLIKLCLIANLNCPVILRCFLGWVYLVLSEPKQF